MAHTFEELKKKSVNELREIAQGIEHEAVKGYTQLNKEHLLLALCTALGIDTHAHHQVIGLDKTKIKAKMHELKARRAEALAAHDRGKLRDVRLRLHAYRHKIKKSLD